MADIVKLIECPRDAWQGLKGQIPADIKRALGLFALACLIQFGLVIAVFLTEL